MKNDIWKYAAYAMAAILMVMLTYFINSNSAQWQAIGCLKERVSKIEGKLEGRNAN